MIVGDDIPRSAQQIKAIAEVVKAAALYVREGEQNLSSVFVLYDRLADAVSDWEDACPGPARALYASEED